MKRKPITDNRARRYIRIEKDNIWEQIDMLSSEGKYQKSFNRLINDALEIGLPGLIKKTFGDISPDNVQPENKQINYQENYYDSEPQKGKGSFENQVLRLLHEIIINELIVKSNVDSLFEAKNLELHGERVDPQYFEKGYYQETPHYLQSFEIKELKKLRDWRE